MKISLKIGIPFYLRKGILIKIIIGENVMDTLRHRQVMFSQTMTGGKKAKHLEKDKEIFTLKG